MWTFEHNTRAYLHNERLPLGRSRGVVTWYGSVKPFVPVIVFTVES